MWTSIVEFFVSYLKDRPITDCLLICFIGVFLWMEQAHTTRTKEAHTVLHSILQERDANEEKRTEANERNTERIISALTGVKQEVKKNTAATKEIPIAAAKAAARIVEGAAADGDKPE